MLWVCLGGECQPSQSSLWPAALQPLLFCHPPALPESTQPRGAGLQHIHEGEVCGDEGVSQGQGRQVCFSLTRQKGRGCQALFRLLTGTSSPLLPSSLAMLLAFLGNRDMFLEVRKGQVSSRAVDVGTLVRAASLAKFLAEVWSGEWGVLGTFLPVACTPVLWQQVGGNHRWATPPWNSPLNPPPQLSAQDPEKPQNHGLPSLSFIAGVPSGT